MDVPSNSDQTHLFSTTYSGRSDDTFYSEPENQFDPGFDVQVHPEEISSFSHAPSELHTPTATTKQDDIFRRSSHPYVLFFTLLFRVGAILVYLFSGIFDASFVFAFILCVLLLAADFWMVKNVSGRLLVGLRWWNKVDEEGNNQWIFESCDRPEAINKSDSRVFWFALWIFPLCWVGLIIIAVLKFNLDWLLICVVALLLTGANLYGYMKCSKDAKNAVKNYVASASMDFAMRNAMSNIGGSTTRGYHPTPTHDESEV
eukprot:Rmarinus@m.7318